MPVTYLSTEQAIARPGLRMVVVGNVPSPWGEAAKGIFHIKRLDWAAVRLGAAPVGRPAQRPDRDLRQGAAARRLGGDPAARRAAGADARADPGRCHGARDDV